MIIKGQFGAIVLHNIGIVTLNHTGLRQNSLSFPISQWRDLKATVDAIHDAMLLNIQCDADGNLPYKPNEAENTNADPSRK